MANADTPEAAHRASTYGAMGIGLCRTERMFNAKERLPLVLEMILAETTEDREAALTKLLPMQRSDFKEIFRVMAPRPVTVRLPDPPIHEFLPSEQTLIDDIEHLRHLRQTAQGLEAISQILGQVNPKAVEQLGILNDKATGVRRARQEGRDPCRRPAPCMKSTRCWVIAVCVWA